MIEVADNWFHLGHNVSNDGSDKLTIRRCGCIVAENYKRDAHIGRSEGTIMAEVWGPLEKRGKV